MVIVTSKFSLLRFQSSLHRGLRINFYNLFRNHNVRVNDDTCDYLLFIIFVTAFHMSKNEYNFSYVLKA